MKLSNFLFLSSLLTLTFSLPALATDSGTLHCGKSNAKHFIVTTNAHDRNFTANFRHNFFTAENMVCSGWDLEKANCIGYLDGTKNLIEVETTQNDQGQIIAHFKQLRGGALEGQLSCGDL